MSVKSLALHLMLAAAAFGQQSEDEKKKEEEAKAKIADFKKELRTSKSDKDVARALEGLGSLQHPKVLLELKTFLSKSSEITIAAAEQIGKYKKDKDAAESLMAAATGQKDKECTVKCIRYAGDTEFKGIIPKLTNMFRSKEVGAAKEAVDSCGKIKGKDAVDPLLSLWKELDAIKEDKAGQGGGGILGGGLGGGLTSGGVGQSMQDEQLKRKRDLTPAVETALQKITGEEFKDLRTANEWWRKNRGTFKDPE